VNQYWGGKGLGQRRQLLQTQIRTYLWEVVTMHGRSMQIDAKVRPPDDLAQKGMRQAPGK
jgi:hypothetical protein